MPRRPPRRDHHSNSTPRRPGSGQERPGPRFVGALLLAFIAAILVALSSYLWVDWGSSDERTLYSTISLTVAGVLLGMLVQTAAGLDGRVTVGVVLVVAVVFTAGGLGIAHWKNQQPIDVTDKVSLGEKDGHTVTVGPGAGFDLSVPLPEPGHTLRLTLSGTDLDPATGSDCVPGSVLHLTGTVLPDGKQVRFDKAVSVPIAQEHDTVRLRAELETGPACRIKVALSRAVIDP